MSAVLSSARPNRSPRSFRAWLAFCTALVTLSAAECSILLPADKGRREEASQDVGKGGKRQANATTTKKERKDKGKREEKIM